MTSFDKNYRSESNISVSLSPLSFENLACVGSFIFDNESFFSEFNDFEIWIWNQVNLNTINTNTEYYLPDKQLHCICLLFVSGVNVKLHRKLF